MGQPPKKKLVVLEVSPVAASTGKRRKPEESEEKPSQVQRIRLRPRQRRNPQKQPLRNVVTRTLSQLPLGLHSRPEPLKQRLPRQTGSKRAATSRPQLQPALRINAQRPKSRTVRATQLQQNSELQEYRTQEGQTKEEKKLVSNPQINPWAVNPKVKIEKFRTPAQNFGNNPKSNFSNPRSSAKGSSTPPPTTFPLAPSRSPHNNNKSFSLSSPFAKRERSRESFVVGKTGRNRESQNLKLIDAERGDKGHSLIKILRLLPFKQLTDSRNRRRENRQSQVGGTVSRGKAPMGTTGAKRKNQAPHPQALPNQKNQASRRLQKRPLSPWVYIIRLLILGIGIGAIAGTLLSALEPTTQASVKNSQDALTSQVQQSPSATSSPTQMPLGGELSPLKTKIQALLPQYSTLQAGVLIIDLDTGGYLDLNSDATFSSASTIKLPILIALFQDVEAGKVRLDESLTLKPEMIVGGSGELQSKKPGTQYLVLEVAKKMITISDNTATNMLIDRLGGIEALNQRFHSWGLTATVLRNLLPDVEGTNTTSAKELANLILMVNQGQLVSVQSHDRILDIMQQTQTNTLLPKGLGVGATIAHKTGTIGSLLADVGLVDIPTGKRYIISVMVKRPHNDITAEQLIRQISRTAYDYFNQPRPTPNTTSIPSGSSPIATKAIASEQSGEARAIAPQFRKLVAVNFSDIGLGQR